MYVCNRVYIYIYYFVIFYLRLPGKLLKSMPPWFQEVLGLVYWGSTLGWFGLSCPAHCTASGAYLLSFAFSGFCLGFLLGKPGLEGSLCASEPYYLFEPAPVGVFV